MPDTQANRDVSVSTALGADALLFHRMNGTERLGRLPEYRLQLFSTNHAIRIDEVLGKSLTVRLTLADGKERHWNGIVTRFGVTGWNDKFAVYEATVHPWLWLLKRSSNCRIFQNRTVIEIVKEVCAAPIYGGLADLSGKGLSGEYPKLPFCVQYRETDFDFVCRLLEHAGIYFYFTHDSSRHTMVLADSYAAHSTIAGYGALAFCGESGANAADRESVQSWSAAGEIASGAYVLNDYDFEKAAASASGSLLVRARAAASTQPLYELFDYPGTHATAQEGEALALGRMESVHGQGEQVSAATNARGLYPGGLFGLSGHPRADQNRAYLVTATDFTIEGDDYASAAMSRPLRAQCRFTAIGADHGYRPLPHIARPRVQGPQTAIVVGKPGEEIWTDKYGRIKVQFHWDRDGKDDDKSSCWVRVSQAWAGKGWGTMFIPRVGMEVVVDFLEGDPDRPLVTGCVYNSDAMPPYTLPQQQSRSTIKSHSIDGSGFNEIRLDDKKDAEEIFVQAEKDYLRVVKNNDTLKVGHDKKDKGDQTISIHNDQQSEIGHDQQCKVGNDQRLEIGKDQCVTIKADHKLDVGGKQAVDIGGDQTVSAGKSMVLKANSSIELKVGASSIKIEPGKITIKAPEVLVQADANLTVKSGAMASIKSGAIMSIEGALVKIN
ncbi:type VI secretion system Vgr family protein [Massilia scottii]|uniref:type VI secretion system Vgr family protein n=1 Tax=Massilia scottii TaxID=3057166 RepID=UPI0027964997|nr:type VI secretion system tip protein TssI/VgrG [Massilia sp. CCM 9029]MDQ1832425.1 type VI secretion system tip protein TssI/VgrG [Massilia sp. CCM 9029]